MAFLVTLIIVIIFLVDPKVNTAPPEQVTYVETLSLEPHRRSDHRRPEEGRGRLLAAKKEKQRQFKELENQLGM